MKNFLYAALALLFCVLLAGGIFSQTNKSKSDADKELTNQNTSIPETEEGFVNGEKRLKSTSDFELNHWYRFYVDETNPASEAYIIINLNTGEGVFNGLYREPGSTMEMDLPYVKIGISTYTPMAGYIYWSDNIRLSVDAEVRGGDGYLDIYLDENVFTGMGDNKTIPSVWFELSRDTRCIAIGEVGGGRVMMLEDEQEEVK